MPICHAEELRMCKHLALDETVHEMEATSAYDRCFLISKGLWGNSNNIYLEIKGICELHETQWVL